MANLDAGYPVAADEPDAPAPAPFVPPPVRPEPAEPAPPAEEAAAVAAPAFLAGRRPAHPRRLPKKTSFRRGMSMAATARRRRRLSPRTAVESPRRRAYRDCSRAILALGVAAVIFLPGLLNKGPASRTPLPSIVIPSGLAHQRAHRAVCSVRRLAFRPRSSLASPPTEQPSLGPVSSPQLYRIKPGDTLGKIAQRFGVTVADILAANPQITNPDNIFVGELIVIPSAVPPNAQRESPSRAALGVSQRGAKLIAVILPASTRNVASRCCD